MSKKSYDLLFKLLLIGDSGVGKTCLLFRYADDTFSPTFISTIGIDFKIKTIELNGLKIKLQIWDTAGQERFHTITTSYYRGAMGILLVYDVTNRKSFENITNWIGKIQTHASESVQKLIVANKCDMDDRRVVTTAIGQSVASEHGVGFIEASAKTGENVCPAFEQLTLAIMHHTKSTHSYREAPAPSINPSSTLDQRSSGCCK